MSLTVTLVGSSADQLSSLLRGAGATVTSLPASALPGLAQAGAVTSDVLVIDLRPQAGLPDELPAIRRHNPDLGVVLVSATLDPQRLLAAMRAGVNEWLAEPLTAEEVGAALSRVARPQSPDVQAKVFAFVGAKGGVGTTTVAVNTATAIAKGTGAPTLMIDLHLAHGDAAVLLGVEPRFSVADALEHASHLDEAFLRGLVVKSRAGVDLLASSERPLVTPPDSARIRALLEAASRLYRYVVLDAPRSDGTVLDSLDGATTIVVVANQELATVRNASRLAATFRQRYGGGRVRVVISRYDRESPIGSDDVAKATGGAVAHAFPSDYRLVVQTVNQGQPLVLGNHSALAASFQTFADGLTGPRVPTAAKKPAERPRGLLGRWGL
jgi:pilus assembly protein CpaE